MGAIKRWFAFGVGGVVGFVSGVVGAIFTAGGHMTQHLRPIERYEDPIPAQPIRVCVKCGRQVDPSAGFCPSCGNQLLK